MADNSTLPVNVGTEVFANDDVGGVKYPRTKITWGADGVAGDATIANPLPTTDPLLAKGFGTAATALRITPASDAGTLTVLQGANNGGTWVVEGKAGGVLQPVTIDPTQLGSLGQVASTASVPVVLANDYGMPLATDKMFAGTTALTPQFAIITASASGDTAIVAAVAGKKIRVVSLKLTASAAVNVLWRSATTPKTGLSYFAAAGDGEVLPFNPVGWFETVAGDALNINLSAAVAVGGHLNCIYV